MNERIKFIIGGIIVVAAIVLTLFRIRKRGSSETQPKIYPTKMDIIKKKVIYGNLEPRREVELKSEISGILEKLYLDVGNKIKKGAYIARITPQISPRSIEKARSEVEIAKINFENVKKQYLRNQILLNKKVISKKNYETSEKEYLTSDENYKSAIKNLSLVEKGYVPGGAKPSNIVKSTIDGRIMKLPLRVGSSVIERSTHGEGGSTVAIIADMDDMIFKGYIDERDSTLINVGKEFHLKLNAVDNKTLKTKITIVSPKGEKKDQGAIKYYIEGKIIDIPEDFPQILSGYTATAEIILQQVKNVISIQERFLVDEDDKYYVYVGSGNNKKKKEIKIGISDGVNVEVKEGLTLKDQLWVDDKDK